MILMQHTLFCLAVSSLFVASAASLSAQSPAPIAKEQLMTPPAGARHYTISSMAGKHGDIWSWALPNGCTSYRMSMNLRGWITEEDEQVTFGPDGRATAIAVRGYNDSGDATENSRRRRARQLDRSARRSNRDRRPRQDPSARPLGLAPARWW